MITYTPEQFKEKYGQAGLDAVKVKKQEGFFANIKQKFNERVEKGSEAIAADQNIGSKILQTVGQGAGFIGDVAFEGVKAVTPEFIEKPVGEAVKAIGQTEPVQNVVEKVTAWAEQNPEAAKNLQAIVDIGSLIPIGKGAQVGAQAVKTGTVKAVEKAAPIIAKAGGIVDTGVDIAKGVKDVAGATAQTVKTIPGRIATNVGEMRVAREAIEQLPTKVAKQAAQNGVDVQDVKYLYEIPKVEKEPLKKLFNVVQDYAEGKTKTDPIEIVGKPIVNRIKTLEKQRGVLGQQLGKVADNLGEVTTKEVVPVAFKELKKVPGLNGLKISSKGKLDFTDTVLSTAETAADRKAIQNIFFSAAKNGTGKQKHLLRQELFEVLGGKKKALSNLTDTQERAYEAIRKSLSDVLDTKNSQYKTLNKKYAVVSQPLQDIRKFMKNVAKADEDILNMKAGLLARRLTSNAASNPEIRNILRQMDRATKRAGKTELSVENLQDFYNVLDKYYDIAGGTTAQKQIQIGVEKAGGITEMLMEKVGQFAGKTDAVKRKAIKEAIEDALGN